MLVMNHHVKKNDARSYNKTRIFSSPNLCLVSNYSELCLQFVKKAFMVFLCPSYIWATCTFSGLITPLQPLYANIITAFQRQYRKHQLRYALDAFELGIPLYNSWLRPRASGNFLCQYSLWHTTPQPLLVHIIIPKLPACTVFRIYSQHNISYSFPLSSNALWITIGKPYSFSACFQLINSATWSCRVDQVDYRSFTGWHPRRAGL